MNLGNALWALGERHNGTARLEEAVAAYRAALTEMTHDRLPREWAQTEMTLGTVLWALGSRESGTARLEEAVTAFESALEEWTRDRTPLDWAVTQMRLGVALATLGERESGTVRLEQAIVAWDNCLTVAGSLLPPEWVDEMRADEVQTRTEIKERQAK